jgi:uncharacterized protein YxeA
MLLSVPGTLRMILIIIGVFVIVRFIGRLLTSKRNIDADKRYHQNNDAYKRAKEQSDREKGKVHVVEDGYSEAEDVDFEEIKEDKP